MFKSLMMGASALLSLGLGSLIQGPPPPRDDPPPKAKKGGGPEGELRKTYDLLRRVRSSAEPTGRPEERLRDWTDRATKFYRRAVEARDGGDPRKAHEYGAAAHDLARAVDHARNAALSDRKDDELPPPGDSRAEERDRARRDLRRAYDRIGELRDRPDGGPEADARFYTDAARDLYNAARKDIEQGRVDRGGELARAAEAMTHVPDHLAHLDGPPPGPGRDRPEPPKKKGGRRERPEPPKPAPPRERDRPADDLPPPIDR